MIHIYFFTFISSNHPKINILHAHLRVFYKDSTYSTHRIIKNNAFIRAYFFLDKEI